MVRLRVLALPLALAFAIAAVALLFRRRDTLQFVYSSPPLSPAAFAALGQNGWQPRVLMVDGDVALRGLVRPGRDPAAPNLLFFQGNSTRLLAEAQEFLDRLGGEGARAVFAYRGYDGSGGRPGRADLVRDGLRIYQQLAGGEWRGGETHVVAFSMGTGLAAAVVLRAEAGEKGPASLSLLAPFTALEMLPRSRLARLFQGERYETLPDLARVRAPVLLVHGDKDDVLPVSMGRALRDALGSRAAYAEIPGGGHVPLLSDDRALQAVRAFIASHRRAAGAPAP